MCWWSQITSAMITTLEKLKSKTGGSIIQIIFLIFINAGFIFVLVAMAVIHVKGTLVDH